MSWYNLRVTGLAFDPEEPRQVSLRAGGPSLEGVLFRLQRRVEEGIDEGRGKFANGLRCALCAQLALGQWDCWSNYRDFEQGLAPLAPQLDALLRTTRYFGNSSPEQPTPGDSPESPLIS
jgi:hypothetical protein